MFVEVEESNSAEIAIKGLKIKSTGSIEEIKEYLKEAVSEVVCDDEFNYFVDADDLAPYTETFDPIAQKRIQFYIDREKLLVKKLSDIGIDELTDRQVYLIIKEVNKEYSQEKLDKIIEKYSGIKTHEAQIKRSDSTKNAAYNGRIKQISLRKFKRGAEFEKQKATTHKLNNDDIKIDVKEAIETITNYSNFAKSYIVIFNRFSMIESIIKYFHEQKDERLVITGLNDMLRRYYAYENVIIQKIAHGGVDLEILHLVCVIVSMINTSENFSENIDMVHNLLLFDK